MKRVSELTFSRYARGQNIIKQNKFKYNVITNMERVRNSTAKTQISSTLPEGVGTLGFKCQEDNTPSPHENYLAVYINGDPGFNKIECRYFTMIQIITLLSTITLITHH